MAVLHQKMIVQLVAVLSLAAALSKAEVSLELSAYRNLLVSLPPNLKNEDEAVLLDSMKDLLEKTSRVLHSALDIRIGDVTFLLPDSWDVSGFDPATTFGSNSREESDIVVESVQDNPFGKHPLATQFGGCGVRGSRITLSPEFLTAPEDYPKGKLLAREWLKYRYGVFDENGIPGDPLYPSHYIIPGIDEEVQVTECTDPQVEYIFKDSKGNNCSLIKDSVDTCKIHPGEMSAENVTSSLMYFHEELPNVNHVCGKEYRHNNLSPSKQNVLCGEKSIWEVIQESPDFQILPAAGVEYESPVYQYAKERKPKVALVFENTIHLSDKKDELIFAMQRLVFDLPAGSHLSLYNFMDESDDIATLRPMTELTERLNVVPPSDFDANGPDVCPLCALEKAVDGFPSDDTRGSVILIVGSPSTREDNSALVEKLKASQLCLTVIALRDPEATIDGYSAFLSELDCKSLVEIPKSEKEMEAFDALYEAMMSSVPATHDESSKAIVASGVMSSESAIQIPANPTAAKFTLWLGRPLRKNIVCKEGDVEISISEFDPLAPMYTFDATDKDVTCNLKNPTSAPVLTQVQMTTKPGQFFAESVWIHDPTPENSKEQLPVIIYAKVNFGDYPVSNARVKATVKNSDGQVGDSFELYDNGKGDPDVTKGDGVYSRYFFQFNKEDDYYVSVETNDNGGMARALKNGDAMCCGSEVKAQKEDPVPTFTRTSQTSFHAVSAKPEQGYPPSKIIDLRVGQYKPPTLLELKWTAPGGEVDTGKASVYKFKLFCDDSETECRKNGSLPAWISLNDSNPEPKEAGREEAVRLLMSNEAPANATVLIAVEAVRLNQSSGLSNRVRVRLTGVEVPDPTPTPPEGEKDDSNPVSVGTIVGASVVGVVVLFCIVVLVCFLVSRGRRRRELKPQAEVDGTERSGSFKAGSFRSGSKLQHPMRRVESFPVILYTHDQIKDVKGRGKVKEPPLFRAEVAAKPWMSLGELPSGGRDDRSSDGSGSTVRVNGEMKQVNDEMNASEIRQTVDRVAKF